MSSAEGFETIHLPDDALPKLEELTGDLQLVAEIVGVRLAIELGIRFHGTAIRVWGAQRFVRRMRDRRMRAEADAGATGLELARRYQLSERQVWNILGTPEPDERQLPLF